MAEWLILSAVVVAFILLANHLADIKKSIDGMSHRQHQHSETVERLLIEIRNESSKTK